MRPDDAGGGRRMAHGPVILLQCIYAARSVLFLRAEAPSLY